jgi:hypothetical protein
VSGKPTIRTRPIVATDLNNSTERSEESHCSSLGQKSKAWHFVDSVCYSGFASESFITISMGVASKMAVRPGVKSNSRQQEKIDTATTMFDCPSHVETFPDTDGKVKITFTNLFITLNSSGTSLAGGMDHKPAAIIPHLPPARITSNLYHQKDTSSQQPSGGVGIGVVIEPFSSMKPQQNIVGIHFVRRTEHLSIAGTDRRNPVYYEALRDSLGSIRFPCDPTAHITPRTIDSEDGPLQKCDTCMGYVATEAMSDHERSLHPNKIGVAKEGTSLLKMTPIKPANKVSIWTAAQTQTQLQPFGQPIQHSYPQNYQTPLPWQARKRAFLQGTQETTPAVESRAYAQEVHGMQNIWTNWPLQFTLHPDRPNTTATVIEEVHDEVPPRNASRTTPKIRRDLNEDKCYIISPQAMGKPASSKHDGERADLETNRVTITDKQRQLNQTIVTLGEQQNHRGLGEKPLFGLGSKTIVTHNDSSIPKNLRSLQSSREFDTGLAFFDRLPEAVRAAVSLKDPLCDSQQGDRVDTRRSVIIPGLKPGKTGALATVGLEDDTLFFKGTIPQVKDFVKITISDPSGVDPTVWTVASQKMPFKVPGGFAVVAHQMWHHLVLRFMVTAVIAPLFPKGKKTPAILQTK